MTPEQIIHMTAEEIERHNAQVDQNLKIIRDLWNELDRKPTLAEIEQAITEHAEAKFWMDAERKAERNATVGTE